LELNGHFVTLLVGQQLVELSLPTDDGKVYKVGDYLQLPVST